MKVVNEKFEVLEEGAENLFEVAKSFPERRIFVEVKGNATVILPDDCIVLVLGADGYRELKKPRKERKKKDKGEKESDEEPAAESTGGESLEHAISDGPQLVELVTPTSKTPKRERQARAGKEAGDRRRSLQYNLKEILTKKGTNRFRPMSDRTVEEILENTLTHREEVREWSEYEQVMRIVENLTYLVDKHRRTLNDNTPLKPLQPISGHHIQLMNNIELFIDEIWKTIENLPRPVESYPQESEMEREPSFSTLDPSKPEGKKRKREEEADFDTLAKKVAAIREKNLSEQMDHKYDEQGVKGNEEHEGHHEDLMEEDQHQEQEAEAEGEAEQQEQLAEGESVPEKAGVSFEL